MKRMESLDYCTMTTVPGTSMNLHLSLLEEEGSPEVEMIVKERAAEFW